MASHHEYIRHLPTASRIRENLNACSKTNLDNRIRFLLVLNDAVALSLGFAVGATTRKAAFTVVAAFLAVSFVSNIAIVLASTIAKHPRGALMLPEGNQAPSLFVLALDIFLVVATFILYIITTVVETDSDSWDPVVMMVYVSVGALVAMIMHGWLVASGLVRYVRYRRSLWKERCPHCHAPTTFRVDDPRSALSPVESPSPAEGEGETLLAKDQK
ncbi:hypothetical protein PV08_03513 [Exophiala spinifera]|uniref:MARVEL domain-containing protein n=1 Tax=Exophiala spinifera TaxID=91928 RepID=A0A0D2C6L3_9EURO|nr:uncharacterized protein PV08_03513 [Exophiala spinifera]KIW19219.1 hypothetical protein PV08_03513 [Exophiala spinifera]